MEACVGESVKAPLDNVSCIVMDAKEGQRFLLEPILRFPTIPEPIKKFAEEREMLVTQVNCQRIFGPKKIYRKESNNGRDEFNWMPCKGSEVFVGKIPRNCFETEIIPHFEKAGNIFQIRLMMDFSGTNKGYCFVTYFTPEQANRAVEMLDKSEIRRGRVIAVAKSVDNCKLLIGGLPTFKTEKEIFNLISKFTKGVVDVQIKSNKPMTSKGKEEVAKAIATVTFDSHRAAAMMRSRLLSMNVRFWGFKVSVDWAEPELNKLPDYLFYQTPQVLRVGNLPKKLQSVRKLTKLFNEASNSGVRGVRLQCRRGVILFETRAQAEMAKVSVDGRWVDGRRIFVDWFDPSTLNLSVRRKSERQRKRRFRNQMLHKVKVEAPNVSSSLLYLQQDIKQDYVTTRGGPNNEEQITEVTETTTTTLLCTTPIVNNSSPPGQFGTSQFNFSIPPSPEPAYPLLQGIQEVGQLLFTFYPANVLVPVFNAPVTFVPAPYSLPCACPTCQAFVSFQNLRLY